MEYVGLDLSLTGTGMVKLSKDEEILYKNVFSTGASTQIEERILTISFEILSRIVYESMIYIEGLSYGSRGQKMLEISGLHYCIRCQLTKDGRPFKIIPPTTLKKFITGTGRAQKNLMLLKIYKKFGIEFDSDNIADAYSLARLALEENK